MHAFPTEAQNRMPHLSIGSTLILYILCSCFTIVFNFKAFLLNFSVSEIVTDCARTFLPFQHFRWIFSFILLVEVDIDLMLHSPFTRALILTRPIFGFILHSLHIFFRFFLLLCNFRFSILARCLGLVCCVDDDSHSQWDVNLFITRRRKMRHVRWHNLFTHLHRRRTQTRWMSQRFGKRTDTNMEYGK